MGVFNTIMGSMFSSDSDKTDEPWDGYCFPTIVCVEGNIGSGKTTFLDNLENDGHVVIRERVNTWNFLGMRYSDPLRWACTSQTEIAVSLHVTLRDAITKAIESKTTVIFMERSIFSCLMFSKVNMDNNILSHVEFELLSKLASALMIPFKRHKQVCVLLDCPTETCMRRIQTRNRPNENVSMKYLTALETQFSMFKNNESTIVIDSRQPEDDILRSFYLKSKKLS